MQIASVSATGAGVTITVPEAGTTTNLLRKPGSASYDAANLVMPIGTDEVSQFQTTELIPSDKCSNGKTTGPNQCLHLWLTKVKSGTRLHDLVRLRGRQDADRHHDDEVPVGSQPAHRTHFPGNNPSANWTQCTAAQALNGATGLPGNGNPPKAFLD